MPTVLILSSHVAASPVGGGAQAALLERMGVAAVFVPTVLFGRHPGLGPPGGGAIGGDVLEGVITGVESSGALAGVDAMIAGYFATAAQVSAAVRLIETTRAASAGVRIVVDPIMGDEETGLYVRDDVAGAIARELIPRADLIAPNAWELGRLSGLPVSDVASALKAARALGRAALVSSVPVGDDIGVLLASDNGDFLASHRREATALKGSGDLLIASFVGHSLMGEAPRDALAAAVGEIAASVAGRAAPIHLERI